MPETPSIWDVVDKIPAARSSDPVTSHESAEELNSSGSRRKQLEQVLIALKRFPGSTSAELAMAASLDRHLVARRLPELETLGLVARGEPRICTASKKNGLRALTWSAA